MDRHDSDPAVQRAEGITKQLPASHEEEISRLIQAQAHSVADRPTRMMEAELRAAAPLAQLVKQDPSAAAAVRDLEALNREASEAAMATVEAEVLLLRGPTGVVHPAKPGLSIFGPPYDWTVLQPTQGRCAAAFSDAGTGTSTVHHNYDGESQGWRVATAGVSMALQANIGGFARIAPVQKYEYNWRLNGWGGLSAHTEGWCELIVQDGSGGVLPQGRRTVSLWSHTSQTHADGEGADQIYVPDIETTVALNAGQIFHVTLIGAAVLVDSGNHLFAYSNGVVFMRNWVPFFTVTLPKA
jgi:hypothetical protein